MPRVAMLCATLAMLLAGGCLFAQTGIVRFEHLTADDGLSHSNVLCILKDHEGQMWLGTGDGLNRYDAATFHVYKHDQTDSTSLPGNIVRALHEDKNGILWIGTNAGLASYNRDLDSFMIHDYATADSAGIESSFVRALTTDLINNLWIGMDAGGLHVLNMSDNSIVRYKNNPTEPSSLSDNSVLAVFVDSQNKVWVGTYAGGLNLFDRKTQTFRSFKYDRRDPQSIAANHVEKIVEDAHGRIWVATRGGGVCRIVEQDGDYSFVRYKHKGSTPRNSVLSLFVVDQGLWIGTENGGLDFLEFETEKFINYRQDIRNPTGLNNNSIYSILQDENNDLWVGTYSGGLNFAGVSNQAFRLILPNPGDPCALSHRTVSSFYEDKDGIVWITTDGGGLNRFDTKTGLFKHYDTANSNLSRDACLVVLEDSRDDLWVGTWDGGLARFDRDTETFKIYNKENSGLASDNIFAILEDSRDRFWVACFNGSFGLFDRDLGRIRKLYDEDNSGLDSRQIKQIIEDENGHLLLIGSAGIQRFDPDSEKCVETHIPGSAGQSQRPTAVLTVYLENPSLAWVGTTNGLNRWDRETDTFRLYDTRSGLPNDVINIIVPDDMGYYWIGTNVGISRFDPSEGTFKSYSRDDGLQGNQYFTNAAMKSKSGHLYFGGVNGFNILRPEAVVENCAVPKVVLSELNVFGRPVAIGAPNSPLSKHISQTKRLMLNHDQSMFSFYFSALNYTVPSKNQYAFKLEGFEDDWHFVGNERKATYTNLDAGNYIFRVKAANNDGVWNETDTAVAITINPPWWETFWFRTLCLIAFLVVVWTVMRIIHEKKEAEREKQLLQQEREIERLENEKAQEQRERLRDKREMQLVEEAKVFLRKIIDANPSAIYIKDLDGRFRLANQAAAERYRATPDVLLGRTEADFLTNAEQVARYRQEEKDVIESGRQKLVQQELWLDPNTEKEHWYQTIRIPITSPDGSAQQVLCVSTEITDRIESEIEKEGLLDNLNQATQRAGMSEIATEVLHNVGNIISSITTSTEVLNNNLQASSLTALEKANSLLREHQDDLASFFTSNPKGMKLVEYFFKIEQNLRTQHQNLAIDAKRLQEKVKATCEVISAQQDYARSRYSKEAVDLQHSVEQALLLQSGSLVRYGIELEKSYQPVPLVRANKTRLLQILMNLIKNAKESLMEVDHTQKVIRIETCMDEKSVFLKVGDSGVGIDETGLEKLFTYGFTTKEAGHGFGLNSCARYMEEMQGQISAESDGRGKGATFILSFSQNVDEPEETVQVLEA